MPAVKKKPVAKPKKKTPPFLSQWYAAEAQSDDGGGDTIYCYLQFNEQTLIHIERLKRYLLNAVFFPPSGSFGVVDVKLKFHLALWVSRYIHGNIPTHCSYSWQRCSRAAEEPTRVDPHQAWQASNGNEDNDWSETDPLVSGDPLFHMTTEGFYLMILGHYNDGENDSDGSYKYYSRTPLFKWEDFDTLLNSMNIPIERLAPPAEAAKTTAG